MGNSIPDSFGKFCTNNKEEYITMKFNAKTPVKRVYIENKTNNYNNINNNHNNNEIQINVDIKKEHLSMKKDIEFLKNEVFKLRQENIKLKQRNEFNEYIESHNSSTTTLKTVNTMDPLNDSNDNNDNESDEIVYISESSDNSQGSSSTANNPPIWYQDITSNKTLNNNDDRGCIRLGSAAQWDPNELIKRRIEYTKQLKQLKTIQDSPTSSNNITSKSIN